MSKNDLEIQVLAAAKKHSGKGPKAVIAIEGLNCSVSKFTAIMMAARRAESGTKKTAQPTKPTKGGMIKRSQPEPQPEPQPREASVYKGKELNYFTRKNGNFVQAEPLQEGDTIPLMCIGGKVFRKEDFIEFLQKSLPEVQFGFPREIEKIAVAELTLETFNL